MEKGNYILIRSRVRIEKRGEGKGVKMVGKGKMMGGIEKKGVIRSTEAYVKYTSN